MIVFKTFSKSKINELTSIWNESILEDFTLPTQYPYTVGEFYEYLSSQSASFYMLYDNQIAGLYVLHPNIEGHGSHIANASYVIEKRFRGKGLGEYLVSHSLKIAKVLGFYAMQYNAVLASNISAIKIYKKLGFIDIGTIPNGYKINSNKYVDTKIMYLSLQ